jgi:5'-nucleotidase
MNIAPWTRVSDDGSWLAAALLATALVLACSPDAHARPLTVVHTNDLHSHLLGFAPNADYTPLKSGDDATVGGYARITAMIRRVREQAPERTLVLDGGDLFMGTLFHTVARQTGAELRLMQDMGYDAAVIGNHEFDFRPTGLARILTSAAQAGPIPALLLSNIRFDPKDPADDSLQALFDKGVVRDRLVLRRAGLTIGLFGLMGLDAAEVEAPYLRPVRFDEPIATARRMADLLRSQDHADVVICLSHGGVRRNKNTDPWEGEDVELLRKVPGIDLVVGGHTHTPLPQPILVGGRPVVQAGSFGRYVGVLELDAEPAKVSVTNYQLLPVDDSKAGDPGIHTQVEAHKQRVAQDVLAPLGLSFDQPVLETAFDVAVDESHLNDSNLGPFLVDAIRSGIDRAMSAHGQKAEPTDLALTTAGVLRDNIHRGAHGLQQTSDLFGVVPLGIGSVDDSVGIPLARVYFYASELRSILEVLSLAYAIKGADYFPYLSGLRFRYDPYRLPLDRVFDIELGDEVVGYKTLDQSAANLRLYSLGTSVYILHFIGIIGQVSHGLLHVIPKNAAGQPIATPEDALLDGDPNTPGVQEVKEWITVLDAVRHLPDTNGNGIPDVPERYRHARPRMTSVASLNPLILFRNATFLMWGASAALVLGVLFAWALLRLARRRLRSKRPTAGSDPEAERPGTSRT